MKRCFERSKAFMRCYTGLGLPRLFVGLCRPCALLSHLLSVETSLTFLKSFCALIRSQRSQGSKRLVRPNRRQTGSAMLVTWITRLI